MRFYENPLKTSENREKQRAYYIPTGSAEYLSLNGEWKFAYFENSDLATEPEKWDTIDVPSCWQLRGYEDPNYTNINFPFPCDMPYVPNVNPMGVYEREFTVTDTNKETYIVFEGVCSCAVLYINRTILYMWNLYVVSTDSFPTIIAFSLNNEVMGIGISIPAFLCYLIIHPFYLEHRRICNFPTDSIGYQQQNNVNNRVEETNRCSITKFRCA